MPTAASPARSTARNCAACRRRRRSPSRRCSTRIAGRRRQAATISPTTPRWPNGPGSRSTTFAGEAGNVKLTTDEDFARAEARRIASLADLRTGTGFDVHAFGDGDHVMLGGVRIPHERGADRPFRCRRRAARAGRRDPRRARRRRHRQAFPAERSALARRLLRSVPEIRGRARDASAAAASRISTSPSSARRRASARTATPCAQRIAEIAEHRGRARRRSRRPPARSSASPAAAKASPRWRPPPSACPGPGRSMLDQRCATRRRALLDLCKAQAADDRHRRILHRRAGGRRADRHRRLVRRGRPRLRHLHQRGQAADARRAGRRRSSSTAR